MEAEAEASEEVSEEDEDDDEDWEEAEETEEALDSTAARRAKRSLNRRVATPRRRPDGSSTFRRPDVTGRRVVVQKAGSEHDGVGGVVDASAHGYSRVLTDDGASLHLRRHEFRLVDDNGDGLTDERPRKRPPRPRPKAGGAAAAAAAASAAAAPDTPDTAPLSERPASRFVCVAAAAPISRSISPPRRWYSAVAVPPRCTAAASAAASVAAAASASASRAARRSSARCAARARGRRVAMRRWRRRRARTPPSRCRCPPRRARSGCSLSCSKIN